MFGRDCNRAECPGELDSTRVRRKRSLEQSLALPCRRSEDSPYHSECAVRPQQQRGERGTAHARVCVREFRYDASLDRNTRDSRFDECRHIQSAHTQIDDERSIGSLLEVPARLTASTRDIESRSIVGSLGTVGLHSHHTTQLAGCCREASFEVRYATGPFRFGRHWLLCPDMKLGSTQQRVLATRRKRSVQVE
jgi:hypothetical protein